jgi:hypothetical protein
MMDDEIMIEPVITVSAAGLVVLSSALIVQVGILKKRLERLEQVAFNHPRTQNAGGDIGSDFTYLSGQRVVLSIQQDHGLTTFAERLANQMRRQGAVVSILPPADPQPKADWDLYVHGSVLCNGYRDVCFKVNLHGITSNGPLPELARFYPEGSPQLSTAIESADFISKELAKATETEQRDRALRELSQATTGMEALN